MNITCNFSTKLSFAESITLSVWFGISGLAAVIGNGAILCTIYKFVALRTVSNLFLTSLASADLIVGFLIDPAWIITRCLPEPKFSDYASQTYGKIVDTLWIHTTISTTFNLCCVTVDRYIAIFYPLRYQQIMTKAKCYNLIAFVWLSSVTLPLSRFLLQDTLTLPKLWLSFTIITVLFPMILVVFCYFWILKAASDKTKRISGGNSQTNTQWMQNYKAAITVGIVVGLFVVSWLPSLVTSFVNYATESECQQEKLYRVVWVWVEAVAFTSSAINPWIYCLRADEFREALHRHFTHFKASAVKPTSSYVNKPEAANAASCSTWC